jgi:hypothetical protein
MLAWRNYFPTDRGGGGVSSCHGTYLELKLGYNNDYIICMGKFALGIRGSITELPSTCNIDQWVV